MSWTNGIQESITLQSGGDNSANKFKSVEINSGGQAIVCNSIYSVGILQNQPKSGEAATVAIEGFSKALAAIAVYPGQFLKNSSGWLTPVNTGDALSTMIVVGRAFTGAASGQQFTVRLQPTLLVTSGAALP